jgi:hypothetical protein
VSKRLIDIDRRLLEWLRGLGNPPDYHYQTNRRSYDHAASKAAEALDLPETQLRDRFLELEKDGLVELVCRPGSSQTYYALITSDGRNELRRSIRAEGNPPIIFVSCGQSTDDEIDLGKKIARIINEETSAEAYFAENQATFEGVSSHILDALSRCVGFVGIMHYRGEVTNLDTTTHQRASVWIEQEIAIAAYRIHTLQESIPVQLYVQKGIKLEGLREKVMLNPVPFKTNSEVLEHFRSALKERFGALSAVAASDLQEMSPLNERERRVLLARRNDRSYFDLRLEIKPKMYRRKPVVFDGDIQSRVEDVVAQTERSLSGAILHEHLTATAMSESVWLHGVIPPPQGGQSPPTADQEIEISSDGTIVLKFAQEDTEVLSQVFRLMSNAYWMIRSLYPLLGIPLKVCAILDCSLHAGRENYNPKLSNGQWTADIDASKLFEEAFAQLALHLTRTANVNWTVAEIQSRLREYWKQNMPSDGQMNCQ